MTLREDNADEALRLLNAAILYLWQQGAERFAADSMILFYNRARLHLAAGRVDDATLNLSPLLVREPSNCEAWLDRALAHQRAGQHRLALRDFEQAFCWGPLLASGLVAHARTLHALGQTGNAVPMLQEAGRTPDATATVHAGLLLAPDDARLWCLLGVLQLAKAHDDAALAALDRALALAPSLADAWPNRATIHWRTRNHAQALADLDHAVALRDDPTMLVNPGRVLERLACWAQAAHDYQRAAILAQGVTPAIARVLERCANAKLASSTTPDP